jgi:glycine cleavage system protein P-like pyridoxal-binding family
MMVRAYTYIRELGPGGLRDVTNMAVLNAATRHAAQGPLPAH